MKKNTTSFQADLILLFVALLWGTTFVASKFVLDHMSPLYIISSRFVLAFLMMGYIFRKEFRNIKRNDLVGGFVVGLVLFIAFVTQLIALQYTEPGKQAFLAGTYVVIVPFISWWLTKIKPDLRTLVGTGICFLGIGLLTLNDGFTISSGDGLTLFSSIFFAAHIITTGHFIKKSTPIKLTIVQFGTVAFLSTFSALIFEKFPTSIPMSSISAIFYLGIVCTGLAYFLQTFSQKYTKSSHTAIILSLEAVFGSVLSIMLMNEVFTIKMFIGCLAILTAILIIELKPKGTFSKKNSVSSNSSSLLSSSELVIGGTVRK